MKDDKVYMFPTSPKELKALEWDYIDVIIFTGDAFIDHPSFGTAVIARLLQRAGYRVAIVPQPNWRDDLRDFKKFGKPRLFFAVNSGSMDSMVNHYTANKRLRSDDAYTPEGKAGYRPDYAVEVYSQILKELYPDTLLVVGGIEASLRRLTHYDYWKDSLLPSILVTSKADFLIYGMGEKAILDLALAVERQKTIYQLRGIPQLAYLSDENIEKLQKNASTIVLDSYENCLKSKMSYAKNFNQIEEQANAYTPKRLAEGYANKVVVVNPPYPPNTEKEIDSYYELPYTKMPHPRYKDKRIPAFEMIKNSITIHRGCFGGCAFCTIAAHQGRFIQSRSKNSVINEIKNLVKHPEFKGVISDIGAPTANMYTMKGKNIDLCSKCTRKSCLFPNRCSNLNTSHTNLLELYSMIENVPGVKNAYIGSGIRYDLFLDEKGFLDDDAYAYFKRVVLKHTSGRFKVAPEHTEPIVLNNMRKPSFKLFIKLKEQFYSFIKKEGKNFQLIPYFISSHPGCKIDDMKKLADNPHLRGILTQQVQDFTPTPMTAASAMFYTGLDLKTYKPIFVEHNQEKKKKQKSYFFQKR